MARMWAIGVCMLLLISVSASASEREDGILRVVTYNIRHGLGMDRVLDLERIGTVLETIQPDVVALNEVDKGMPRSRRVDQARALAEQLGMHHVFGSNLRFLTGAYGNAILSRFPIRSYDNVRLKAKGREQRGLLHVVLDVDGAPLHVLTTHLEVRVPEVREAQIIEIAEYVGALDGPVVLMGDFNSDAGMHDPAGLLFPRLQDAWVVQQLYFGDARGVSDGAIQAGGPTFNSRSPERRIDYIFVSDELLPASPQSVRTVASVASDHLPLVADLGIHGQPTSAALERTRIESTAALAEEDVRRALDEARSGAASVAFVSDLASQEPDAARFQALVAPDVDIVPTTLGELMLKEPATAPSTVRAVVLHNLRVFESGALEWLSDYRDSGGIIVAIGSVGLRLENEETVPAGGIAAGDLFSLQVVGWTRSQLLQGYLIDSDLDTRTPLPSQGLLHLRPIGNARALVRIAADHMPETTLAVAVAGDRTLYVGLDFLDEEPPPALLNAVRRSFTALF